MKTSWLWALTAIGLCMAVLFVLCSRVVLAENTNGRLCGLPAGCGKDHDGLIHEGRPHQQGNTAQIAVPGDDCNHDIKDSQGRIVARTLMACGDFSTVTTPICPSTLENCGQLPQMDSQGRVKNTPCLDKMEAAMRSIDPFVDPSEKGTVSTLDDIVKGHELWKQVKRECWRQP